MEALSGIIHGFSIVLDPQTLFFCFLGCFLGTLIGVLPGLGPGGALAVLLPITFGIPPATAIIMLAGIYYGAMYGGSTTSILINIPGEAASVITCIDGYQMARNGRAGPALGISAIGSFILILNKGWRRFNTDIHSFHYPLVHPGPGVMCNQRADRMISHI